MESILEHGGLYGDALLNAISSAIPTEYSNSIKHAPASIPTLWGGLNAYGSYNNYWTIAPWQNSLDLYVAKDDASKVIGRHTIKFGGQISWNGKNEDTSTSASERPTFGTADWATSVGTGNDVANLLIPGARWSTSETSTNVRAQLRWHDDSLYVADNWKVTPRLTLDLGLRWDLLDAPYQPNNQITNFQPSLYNPAASASDACNGLWVVAGTDPCGAANAQFGTNFSSGTPGPGRALVNNNNHLFSPRVGIAWDPWGDGNTAFRIGAGRFFQRERVSRYTLVANAPFAVTSNITRPLDSTVPLPTGGAAPAGGMDPSCYGSRIVAVERKHPAQPCTRHNSRTWLRWESRDPPDYQRKPERSGPAELVGGVLLAGEWGAVDPVKWVVPVQQLLQ